MSATRTTLTLAMVAISYIAALLVGECIKAGPTDGTSTLALKDATSSCQIENIYVGDGLIRGSLRADQSEGVLPCPQLI